MNVTFVLLLLLLRFPLWMEKIRCTFSFRMVSAYNNMTTCWIFDVSLLAYVRIYSINPESKIIYEETANCAN